MFAIVHDLVEATNEKLKVMNSMSGRTTRPRGADRPSANPFSLIACRGSVCALNGEQSLAPCRRRCIATLPPQE